MFVKTVQLIFKLTELKIMTIDKINTKMTIMKKKTSYIPPSTVAIKLDESLMLGIGSGKTKPEDSDAKRHVGFDVESEADGGARLAIRL